MSLRPIHSNDITIYHCTAGRSKPQWENAIASKEVTGSLRYNESYRRRIEVIQDFEFVGSSDAIQVSEDLLHIGVSGMYGPRLKMFQVNELGMKFERAFDAQIVQFRFLEPGFRKLAILRSDRAVEFHAQYGKHCVIRLPRFGRDLIYDRSKCEVIVAASSSELYRYNLEQGRYLAPYVSTPHPQSRTKSSYIGSNALCQSEQHGLVAVGREDGVVEMWDPRDRTSAALLHIASSVQGTDWSSDYDVFNNAEVSAVAYNEDGLTLGVGTSSGHVLLYDLRSSRPYTVKDHRYELPVNKIEFVQSSEQDKLCVSSDAKSIKLWQTRTGDAWTSIETTEAFHSHTVFPGSGLVMATGEFQRVQIYYIPALGRAPQFCSFLDSMTEEMEEKQETSIYEDYEFVTRQQLLDWNAGHLIGTNLLRAYMHGFFVHAKLYARLKQAYIESLGADSEAALAAVKPTVKQVKAADRILQRRAGTVAVNQSFADALAKSKKRRLDDVVDTPAETAKVNPLNDDRFAAMFEKTEFSIDPKSAEYQRIHPQGMKAMRVTAVDPEDSDDERMEDVEEEEEEEEEEKVSTSQFHRVDSDESEPDDTIGGREREAMSSTARKKVLRELGVSETRKPAMYELKQGLGLSSVMQSTPATTQTANLHNMTLAERLAAAKKQNEPEPEHTFNSRGRGGRGRGRGRERTTNITADSIVEGQQPSMRRTMRGLLPRDDVQTEGFNARGRGRGGRGGSRGGSSRGGSSRGGSSRGGSSRGSGRGRR